MSKNLFALITLCFFTCGQAQQGYVYDFEKMAALDTIPVSKGMDKTAEGFVAYDATLSFMREYTKDGARMPALLYRAGTDLIVYEAPFASEFVEFTSLSDDRKYAFFEVTSYGTPSWSGESSFGETYIINLEAGSYTALATSDYRHHITRGEENDEFGDSSYYKSESKVIISGNSLTILDFSFSARISGPGKGTEFGEADSPAGIYELQGEQLLKTHYYDANDKRMKPLAYAGGLAVGMDLRTLEDVLSPYDEVVELASVPQWMYGYDAEEYGYEVRVSGEQHCFVVVEYAPGNVARITALAFVSPKVVIGGLHAGMTVGGVLEKYPGAVPGYDVINDGEYIYIKELQLRLMFLTEPGKRIARYETDAKDGTPKPVQLLDKSRKVDFMMVVK